MSISNKLEPFRTTSRITLNNIFMGDQGAAQLAEFLNGHRKIQSIQIKSNDISPQGFILIFDALCNNSNLKDINIEHNNLGVNDYIQWHDSLSNAISICTKLQRLNLSNNKITSEGFSKLANAIANSRSLKMLQIRYNNISSQQIQQLVSQLKRTNNNSLLYVELTGNKIKRQAIEKLQAALAQNRKKNPLSKQKIMNGPAYKQDVGEDQSMADRTFNRSSTLDALPRDGMVRYLQDILNQTRKDTAENKVRLEQELNELQKKQKIDAFELSQLEKKCNQMIIINRNIKFQLDRTLGEHDQMQKDQDSQLRVHQEKVKQSTKQLQDLQTKYEDMESRMNKQHEIKMKEIVRDWQAKLRNLQEKIRQTQNQNGMLEIDIKKHLQKKQRLRLDCIDEQNFVRIRVEDEQANKYNFTIKNLESKLRELVDGGTGHINRNQELVHELQKSDIQNKKQIQELQAQLADLKDKQNQFNSKSKDFFTKNQKIKAEIQMKQITIDKLDNQINKLGIQIQQRKSKQEQQLTKTRTNFQFSRSTKAEDKKSRLQKLSQVQNNLRLAQLESAKLRQQYGLLAQKLQVNIGLAVHQVFTDNALY